MSENSAFVKDDNQLPNDKEKKKFSVIEICIYIIGAIEIIYTIWAYLIYPWPVERIRGLLLMLTLTTVFLLYPASKKKKDKGNFGVSNAIFLILALSGTIYAFFNLEAMYGRGGVHRAG